MSDIVEEARALLKQHSRIHAMHDSDPAKDVDVAGMIEALADEVVRWRQGGSINLCGDTTHCDTCAAAKN